MEVAALCPMSGARGVEGPALHASAVDDYPPAQTQPSVTDEQSALQPLAPDVLPSSHASPTSL